MSTIQVDGSVVSAGSRGPQGIPGAATPATTSTLGAVIVGDNLTVDETGRVSAPAQTGGVPEAPNDGNAYVREGDAWVQLPAIPAAQVPADWNATTGAARILNKPAIPAAAPYTEYQLAGFGSYTGQNASGTAGDKTNWQRPFRLFNGGRGLQIFLSNSNGLGENTNLYSLEAAASILFPTGEEVPFTFSRNASITFSNTAKQGLWSDPLDGYDFMPGDYIFNMYYDTLGGQAPTGLALDLNRGDKYVQGQTQTNQTLNSGFSYPTNFPAVNIYVYGPMGMRLKNPVHGASAAFCGDSTNAGYGATNLKSWPVLACDGVIDYSCMGSPGEDTQAPVHLTQFNFRRSVADCARSVVWTLGVNSMIHNFDTAGTQKDMIDEWVRSALTGQRVFQTTITPYTDGSNNPLKDAQRQPLQSWLRDDAPVAFNSSIYVYGTSVVAAAVGATGSGVLRAGQPGHPLTGVIDLAQYVEQGGASAPTGKWIAGLFYTGDVTFIAHPNDAGYAAMAAGFNPTSEPLVFSA